MYLLPPFGPLDIDNLEEDYDAEMPVNGRVVQLDLNFEDGFIRKETLDRVAHYLVHLGKLDEQARAAIRQDFETGEAVRPYIEHHLEELEAETLEGILKETNAGLSLEERVLSSLHLYRAGFYPHNRENFITLDYTIGEAWTDYLLVLNFTQAGTLHYITIES